MLSFRSRTVTLTLGLLVALSGAGHAQASEWRWSITPYAWASDVGLDVEVNDREIIDSQVDVKDLIDKLDFVGSAHFEGQKGKGGFFFDLAYFDFTDDPKTFEVTDLDASVTARGDLEQTLLEAGFLFNPSGTGERFTLLVGTRILDIDNKIDFTFSPPVIPETRVHIGETLYDGLVGFRWVAPFAERWTFIFRADASAGGTELTWNGAATVGWELGSSGRYALLLGYRYMLIELDEQDRQAQVETELTMSGFISGFRIAF